MKLTELRNQIDRATRGGQAIAARPQVRVACCNDIPEVYGRLEHSDDPQLRLSQILDGRFLVREIFSRDAVATVYRAVDMLQHKREVALKVPLLSVENEPVGFARFRREEDIGLQLAHPLLQKYFPVAGEKCRPYIVMEFLRGCTLAHLAHEMGPLTEADAFKIATLLCDALGHMHEQGILHCDVQPANVQLCCDRTLRVMNFGFASAPMLQRNVAGQEAAIPRSSSYSAPELANRGSIDARTDIYGLGAILYELLTGSAPLQNAGAMPRVLQRNTGQSIGRQTSNPELSPQAEEIVLRALQSKPEDRYPSMAAFQAALGAPARIPTSRDDGQMPPPRCQQRF